MRTLGPEHPLTLLAKSDLAETLLKEGHLHEAEKLQRETIAAKVRVLGPENPYTLVPQSTLAGILNREGQYAEAEKIARETLEVQIRGLGPQHPDTLYTLRQLGIAMAHRHRYPEASKLFRDVIEKGSNFKGQGSPWSAWYAFACVAVAANHPDDALKYLHEAIDRGYKDADGLMADDDLMNLRQNPRFQELVAELKRPPTKVQAQ